MAVSEVATPDDKSLASSYDFIIVGSGAASVCAALIARTMGKTAVILEKTDMFGGSTAMSGGVLWIPNNPLMKDVGIDDSYEKAKAYLDACVGEGGPGSSPERRHAFLTEAPRAIAFLQRFGMQFVHAEGYSDYHENEFPGGIARSRSIVGEIFDSKRLGPWRSKVRRRQSPPVRMHEVAAITLNGRTWTSRITMLKVGWRMIQNRLGRDLVGMGGAVQARLLEIALRERIPFFLSTAVTGLLTRDNSVVGVRLQRAGQQFDVACGDAVLLDCGGFSHNAAMRQQYQPTPASTEWTFSNPGDTGEMLKMAMDLGAAVDAMDQSWWNSISVYPNGTKGGHPLDLAKPHCIMVDQNGDRYVNEATSYVAVGNAMYARHKTVPAVPSWFVSDRRHRMRYRWAGLPPGEPPEEWVKAGYIIVAKTVEELATRCGIDPARLRTTVDRFNQFAKAGVDQDFGRGRSAYNRFFGDPSNHPNASLGAIEEGPFYAVKLYPGDVGTAGGLVTDEYARVLRNDGTSISGLYATGNVTASVVGRSYPGAGASIGASLVFGYIAAKHALRANS